MRTYSVTSFVIISFHLNYVWSSAGDNSPYYGRCYSHCRAVNCTGDLFKNKDDAETINAILFWSCNDECKYNCMWKTVAEFKRYGSVVPKFHGKWPFRRVFYMQEFGSVVGSLLNLVSNIYMLKKIARTFSLKNTPLLWMWYIFIMLNVNAWLWSTIFHVRDTPFTEFMDYGSALLSVMALFIAFVLRWSFGKKEIFSYGVVISCILVYLDHLVYLYAGNVDYVYNMMVNVFAGALGCICWLFWAFFQIRQKNYYTWQLIAFYIIGILVFLLELYDFPPHFFLLDAHALWHLSTAPLPLIFYRFVINDLHYLRTSWGSIVEEKTHLI